MAIVTGAGSGIGRATANLFAIEGAKVVVADVKPSLKISRNRGTTVQVAVDVSRADEVRRMIYITNRDITSSPYTMCNFSHAFLQC